MALFDVLARAELLGSASENNRSEAAHRPATSVQNTSVHTGAAFSVPRSTRNSLSGLTGYAADHFGSAATLLILAAAGAMGVVLVWARMPETRDFAK